MKKQELIEKICKIFASEQIDGIKDIVDKIPDKVLAPIQNVEKVENGPKRSNGKKVPSGYNPKTKTVEFYEDTFSVNHLSHEIGHCVYHEFKEIAEIVSSIYPKDEAFEVESILHNGDTDSIYSEFLANTYERFKSGKPLEDIKEELREPTEQLIEILKQKKY